MSTESTIALVVILLSSLAAASTGSIFRPGTWYAGLRKPTWVPPNWLFGPAWAVMYAVMSAAAFLVWSFADPDLRGTALGLYAVQLVLNAMWSPVFFGLRRMALAVVEVALLWLAVLATTLAFFQVNYWAGLLFLPYLLWVTFASYLTWTMWRLNRGGAAKEATTAA